MTNTGLDARSVNWCWVVTVALSTLLVTPTSAWPESYIFVSQWSVAGGPHSIAFDSIGNAYVTSHNHHCVRKFDQDGTLLDMWGPPHPEGPGCVPGSEDGQFYFPSGIAVDSLDNVYVGDVVNRRIQKFTSEGEFITKWGTLGSGDGEFGHFGPYGIAVDSVGNVYAADQGNYRIQKFSSDGEFITKWGTLGSGDGEFGATSTYGYGPLGIAVDALGNVYVSDTGNNRIQKFTSNGEFIIKWGAPGSGEGELNFPREIAVDTSGNVYVVEQFNHRIQKFDSSGNFITKWGTPGSGEGQFNNPIGVDVDTSGNVYVVDGANHRIQKFALESMLVVIDIKPGSYPNAINLGSHGLVPVGILSGEEFDATTVDPDTVELAGAGVEVRGKSNKYMAHEEDINQDGLVDIVLQVATQNLDPAAFQDGYGILTGSTYDGQAIHGVDEVTIVPIE